MKYFVVNGNKHQSFFAVNEENTKCSMIELRWKNKIGDVLDGIVLDKFEFEYGNFDWIATTALLTTAETITEDAFKKVKKQVTTYMNN